MEKNITLQQNNIRVFSTKLMQSTPMLDTIKKSRNQPYRVVTAILFERA